MSCIICDRLIEKQKKDQAQGNENVAKRIEDGESQFDAVIAEHDLLKTYFVVCLHQKREQLFNSTKDRKGKETKIPRLDADGNPVYKYLNSLCGKIYSLGNRCDCREEDYHNHESQIEEKRLLENFVK